MVLYNPLIGLVMQACSTVLSRQWGHGSSVVLKESDNSLCLITALNVYIAGVVKFAKSRI